MLRRWRVWAWIALALALAGVGLGVYLGLTKADWPGWLQAAGSLLALVVAFGVVEVQNSRLEAHNARLRKLEWSRDVDRVVQAFVPFIAIGQALDAAVPSNVLPESAGTAQYQFSVPGSFAPASLKIYVDELNALHVGTMPTADGISWGLKLRAAATEFVAELVGAYAHACLGRDHDYVNARADALTARDSMRLALEELKGALVLATNHVPPP